MNEPHGGTMFSIPSRDKVERSERGVGQLLEGSIKLRHAAEVGIEDFMLQLAADSKLTTLTGI